jgi:hypothetical protein
LAFDQPSATLFNLVAGTFRHSFKEVDQFLAKMKSFQEVTISTKNLLRDLQESDSYNIFDPTELMA